MLYKIGSKIPENSKIFENWNNYYKIAICGKKVKI